MVFTPRLQAGDKVFLRGWRHLFGFIERIDGGYHYVRPTNWPKDRPPFELYENEIARDRRYKRRGFEYGDTVTILDPKSLKWGRFKPREKAEVVGITRTHVVVRPVGVPIHMQFELRPSQLISNKALSKFLEKIAPNY